MHNLDELLWSCNGDGALISDADWRRIHDHLFAKLSTFLGSPAILSGSPSVDAGFSTSFTTNDSENCLEHRLRGTFGVDFPSAEYACVQGFVYAYQNDRRVILPSGENHIYIRYARIDADDNDWPMSSCTGDSDWRSYGWSVDEYGEFEGFEQWPVT